MKRDIEKRLDALEGRTFDWVAKLDTIDYGVLEVDYENGDWEELHFDDFVTAVRHKYTNEIRGYCRDRRSDAQIKSEGGLLEFL